MGRRLRRTANREPGHGAEQRSAPDRTSALERPLRGQMPSCSLAGVSGETQGALSRPETKNMAATLPSTPILNALVAKATRCNCKGGSDRGGRWYPTDPAALAYCGSVRPPSRAWPLSYRKALSSIVANATLNFITTEQEKIVLSAGRLRGVFIRNPDAQATVSAKLLELEGQARVLTEAHRATGSTPLSGPVSPSRAITGASLTAGNSTPPMPVTEPCLV